MHICFDGIIFSLQTSGGVSVCFEQIIAGLVRAGQRVTLWGFPGCENSHSWQALSALPASQPHFRMLKVPKARPFERLLPFGEPLPRGAVFHSTYYRLPSRNQRASTKIVTTVHDFTHERVAKPVRRWLLSWQKRRAVLGADVVICVSSRTAADLPRYVPSYPLDRIRIAANGAAEAYRPLPRTENDPARLATLGINSRFALFVGRRVRHKNFEAAIGALADLPLQLVVVGGGPLSPSHRQLLESLLPGRWIAHGWLTEDDLNFLYNHALALLYPSGDEGFGIPVLEASRAGCPTLTTQGGIPPDARPDAELAVPAPTPTAIAEKLLYLSKSDNHAKARERALKLSRDGDWATTARSVLSAYESVTKPG